jgi:hypothetical protein
MVNPDLEEVNMLSSKSEIKLGKTIFLAICRRKILK